METVQKVARLNPNSMYLFEAIWLQIFVRLPVESLCRFRSVCKSWNSLISSSFFIGLRFAFTQQNPPPLHSYLIEDLHFPFQFHCDISEEEDCYQICIVDIVHGLICVSYTLDSAFDSTIIWNPAIHRYSNLPRPSFPSYIDSAVAGFGGLVPVFTHFDSSDIGFGYDRSTDDYKVVRVWLCWQYIKTRCGFIPASYQVYSTRKRLWRTVIPDNFNSDGIMFHPGKSRTGCFVNGTINWLANSYDLSKSFVLMFDCESEELRIVDFPQELCTPEMPSPSVVTWEEVLEYGGMLSAFVRQLRDDHIVQVWVMKEHGLASSWNKLFAVEWRRDVAALYKPSFLKLAPHGPNQRIIFFEHVQVHRKVHGYEENMFFIDDPEPKSYSN